MTPPLLQSFFTAEELRRMQTTSRGELAPRFADRRVSFLRLWHRSLRRAHSAARFLYESEQQRRQRAALRMLSRLMIAGFSLRTVKANAETDEPSSPD